MTYSADLFISADIEATAFLHNNTTISRRESVRDIRIASIPVMVGSELCHTYKTTAEARVAMEEDPHDPGGYFIVKGSEWVVDMSENTVMNGIQIHRNLGHDKERCRCEFISKPGDYFENSFRIIVRYLTTDAINVELMIGSEKKMDLPFYIWFRLFGMTSDWDIIDNIVYGVGNKDKITVNLTNILVKALAVENKALGLRRYMESDEILKVLSEIYNNTTTLTSYKKDENLQKWGNTRTLSYFDTHFLPHIGTDAGSRIKKLRFLGHIIHKLLLTDQKILETTDRDSYKNKRIHTAGIGLSKVFKSQFNLAIIMEIRRRIKSDFQSTPFSQVILKDCVVSAMKPKNLEKNMVKAITPTPMKTLMPKRADTPNRTSSQILYHKNDLNIKSQLNNISVGNPGAAKQNERADEMRRVHPTYWGYICLAQSADTGEKVGLSKQLACSASVTEAGDSLLLKEEIMADVDFIHLDDKSPSQISSEKLCKIFVNGDWIGFCINSHEFVAKYRMKRRYGRGIHEFTTIIWEELVREIHFWIDVGRLIRPLVIVYNNREEYEKGVRAGKPIKFQQWIGLTHEHIQELNANKISMDDLRKQHIIEYISVEEELNYLIAENIDVLRSVANDYEYKYTHCDIDQAIFGLVALASPCGNHTPGSRSTMFTNHKKQSCGWFALNYPYRIDKHTFLQYYCDSPMTRAMTDGISYPNSQDMVVAYQMYSGTNQEDSCIINKSSIDRGLFNGCHYYYEKTEVEEGEHIGNIDRMRTVDIKKNAIYEYLDSGIIRVGTEVHQNYVLISKYSNLPKPIGDYLYVDKSIIYRQTEPAIVESVISGRLDDGTVICKIKLRSNRPICIGDKISSRAGNKGIVSTIMNAVDMPFDDDGIVPDLIVTPNGIPTRMCNGQIIESILSYIGVLRGAVVDGVTFFKNDIEKSLEELRRLGVKNNGYKRLYNGKIGSFIDTIIFMVPSTYNRLLKFIKDENYAVASGPTNPQTRQPLDGKINMGGMRIGEMETALFMAHGAMNALNTKIYTNSDGITMPICRICGNMAIVNERENIYKCRKCGDLADIVKVPSSWMANQFVKTAGAAGIGMTYEVEPFNYNTIGK